MLTPNDHRDIRRLFITVLVLIIAGGIAALVLLGYAVGCLLDALT